MIQSFFLFLIPIMTVWSGYADTGYQQHVVYISTDIQTDCNHIHAGGCVDDFGYGPVIIVQNPFQWDKRGCNSLTHEWLHLMGLNEAQLPYCNDLKIPDYMKDYLKQKTVDSDGDGIPNSIDMCPTNPETFNGHKDKDGCPDKVLTDSDYDGILDSIDQCPDQREVYNGFQDEDGCPDSVEKWRFNW